MKCQSVILSRFLFWIAFILMSAHCGKASGLFNPICPNGAVSPDKVFTENTEKCISCNSYYALTKNKTCAKVSISTIAGAGTLGSMNGKGILTQFNSPRGIAVDSSGNVYVADEDNHRIRKISFTGVVTTFAGSTQGDMDGTGTSAQFHDPISIAIDTSGNIYVADKNNHRIRKISSMGVVTTFAGSTQGDMDGTGTSARFDSPRGIAIDASGNIYVADANNHRIRKISSMGVVTTFAGSTQGDMDGTDTSAKFDSPHGIAIDTSGNIYVADKNNHRIRKISSTGVVTTFAGSTQGDMDGTGTSAQFNSPRGIAIDVNGNIYVADANNHRIRKITSMGVVTILAGSTKGYIDGTGISAQFDSPRDIAIDTSGNIYVADKNNQRIRKITTLQ